MQAVPVFPTRALVGGLAAILLALCGAAASKPADPWAGDGGIDRAKATIAQCLEQVASTPDASSESCVRAAFLKCEAEHGNMSQRDLNECAFFSQRAWEARLAAARSRLMGVKTIDPRFGRSDELVRRLGESDRRWQAWNEADCELQSARSIGGTMHRYELAMCLSTHAAHRALELEGLIFWWEKAFQLPEQVRR